MARKITQRLGALVPALLAGCITVQLPEPSSAPRDSEPSPAPASVENGMPPPVVQPAPAPLRSPAPAASATTPRDYRAQAADIAISMLGRPYLRGGNTPQGFDCSGLVQFSYAKLDFSIPRDTRGLLDTSYAIATSELGTGDLVFFHVEDKPYSHVGLYLRDGRFIHAPSSGGAVRIESLSLPYWAKHFGAARRLPASPI